MNLNWLRDLFFKNLGLKAISLLLAALLWFQVASQQTVQRTITLPLDIINLPPQYEISNDYPTTIDVEVRRSSQAADSQMPAVVIDLKDARAEQKVVALTDANIPGRPSGMEVIRFNPPNISLSIEVKGSRLVPVETRLDGEPAENYQVVGIRVNPTSVWIEGPASAIGKVLSAVTAPIDITGQKQDFTRTVDIFLEEKNARLRGTRQVEVVVQIEEKRRTVTLSGVPLELDPPDPDSRLRSGTVQVSVSVPVSFQGKLNPEEFRAVVNTEFLDPSPAWQEVLPQVIAPDDLDADIFRIESVSVAEVRKRR